MTRAKLAIVCLGTTLSAVPVSGVMAKDFGLAITAIDYGPWNDASECPEGFSTGAREALLKEMDPKARATLEAFEKRVGNSAAYATRALVERRGPNGSDLCLNPTLVSDPPLKVSQSKVSDGFDLDGGDTKNHCAHAEFTDTSGKPGIDNQVRRLTACMRNVFDGRINEGNTADILSGAAVTLLRVGNVDSMENDDDVSVEIYKGRDPFVKDGGGQPVPDASIRADKNATAFKAVTRGKIVNGVLMTDPVDARFAQLPTEFFIRSARLEIKLGADGFSEGMLGGYYDLANFWDSWTRNPAGQGGYTCPSLHQALHKLADGHKDPKTGQCTSLSTAFKIKAVRAFVVPPPQTEPQS